MSDPAAVREKLEELCQLVEDAAGPDVGFALFVQAHNAWHYVSNCPRKDIIAGLTEWLYLTGRSLVKAPGRTETSDEVDERLGLERKCAEIGKMIADRAHMALFLFENGEGGASSAYFSNVPNAREGVATWVKSQSVARN